MIPCKTSAWCVGAPAGVIPLSGRHKGCRDIFSLYTFFFLLTREGQHSGTRTTSSSESRELPVGQFIVSSQHAACQEHRHALLPVSSQQLSPWLIANTLPLVFLQKCSSVMIFPLPFYRCIFCFCARDSTILLEVSPKWYFGDIPHLSDISVICLRQLGAGVSLQLQQVFSMSLSA